MLPDIRAVIAAVVTALVLLTISFGMVAAFRVAQDERAGSLHAELAQRGRSLLPISAAPRVILIVDTPAEPVAVAEGKPEIFGPPLRGGRRSEEDRIARQDGHVRPAAIARPLALDRL